MSPGWTGRHPEQFAGQRAGCRLVDREDLPQEAEILRRDGGSRQVQVTADHLGDIADRHTLVADCVQRLGRQVTRSAFADIDGHTELERPAFEAYGGWGSRLSPVWARNPLMSAGRYWMRLSRFLTMAAGWSVLPGARLPRPFFMFAQTTSAG
jgi:hypothetical protein